MAERIVEPLAAVVAWRGKKDLRDWGGPAAGTVTKILDGTWKRSPQSHGTFSKLDDAAGFYQGTFWGWYWNHPAVPPYRDEHGEVRPQYRLPPDTPRSTVLDKPLSEPPEKVAPTAEGAVGEQGRLVDDERRMVGEAAELLAQAAAILAKIAQASDPEQP